MNARITDLVVFHETSRAAKAIFTVEIDGIQVKGFRLVHRSVDGKLHLQTPRIAAGGKWFYIVQFTTQEAHDEIELLALDAYDKAGGEIPR